MTPDAATLALIAANRAARDAEQRARFDAALGGAA